MHDLKSRALEKVMLADGNILKQFTQDDWINAWFYRGMETLVDAMVIMRPVRVVEIHCDFLSNGSDFVRSLSGSSNPLNLIANGLEDEAFSLNYIAAGLAREAVDKTDPKGIRRYALGHIIDRGWDGDDAKLNNAFAIQAEGLAAGGVDGIYFDPFLSKGRVQKILSGIREGIARTGRDLPILVIASPDDDALTGCDADLVLPYKTARRLTPTYITKAIEDQNLGILSGGTHPSDTAKFDTILRENANDGYRPGRGAMRDLADELSPISAWRRF